METKPRVSVISPVYKVAAVLPRFIESVLAQTDPDFEFILVDDGSPDDSGRICDEYAAKDSRIRVIHQKNGGACAARNAGIEAARGEYFLILDSDDAASPLMIQWALRRQAQYPNDLIVWDFVTDLAELAGPDALDKPYREWVYPAAKLPAYYVTYKSGNLYNRLFHAEVIRRYNVRFDVTLRNSNDIPFCQAYHEAHFKAYPDSAIRQTDMPLYYWDTTTVGSLSKQKGTGHQMDWEPEQYRGYAAKVQAECAGVLEAVGDFNAIPLEDANSICRQYLRRFAFGVWAARELGEPVPRALLRGPETRRMLAWMKQVKYYHAYYWPFVLGNAALVRAVYHSDESGAKRLYWKLYWAGYYLLGGNWNR